MKLDSAPLRVGGGETKEGGGRYGLIRHHSETVGPLPKETNAALIREITDGSARLDGSDLPRPIFGEPRAMKRVFFLVGTWRGVRVGLKVRARFARFFRLGFSCIPRRNLAFVCAVQVI